MLCVLSCQSCCVVAGGCSINWKLLLKIVLGELQKFPTTRPRAQGPSRLAVQLSCRHQPSKPTTKPRAHGLGRLAVQLSCRHQPNTTTKIRKHMTTRRDKRYYDMTILHGMNEHDQNTRMSNMPYACCTDMTHTTLRNCYAANFTQFR